MADEKQGGEQKAPTPTPAGGDGGITPDDVKLAVQEAVAEVTAAYDAKVEELKTALRELAESEETAASFGGGSITASATRREPTRGYVLREGHSYHDANGDYAPGDVVQLTEERAREFIRDGVVDADDESDDEVEEAPASGAQTAAPKGSAATSRRSRRRTS